VVFLLVGVVTWCYSRLIRGAAIGSFTFVILYASLWPNVLRTIPRNNRRLAVQLSVFKSSLLKYW